MDKDKLLTQEIGNGLNSVDVFKNELGKCSVMRVHKDKEKMAEFFGGKLGITSGTTLMTITSGYETLLVDENGGFIGLSHEFDYQFVNNNVYKKCLEVTGLWPEDVFALICLNSKNNYEALAASTSLGPDEQMGNNPVQIEARGKNFSTMSGRIDAGDIFVKKLAEALIDGDDSRIKAVKALIGSQYFHEKMHHFREDKLDDVGNEEITQLAEFLYDPQNNMEENNRIEHEIRYVSKVPRPSYWNHYDEAFQNVVLPILRKEVGAETDNIELVNRYRVMPIKKRMEIVKKYMVIPRNELYDRFAQ